MLLVKKVLRFYKKDMMVFVKKRKDVNILLEIIIIVIMKMVMLSII